MRTARLAAIILSAATNAAAQNAVWTYDIDFDPGNFPGGSADVTSFSNTLFPDGLTINRNFDNGISVDIRPVPTQRYAFDIAIDGNVDPFPGFFDNATRFPFQDPGENGLSISTPGRGYNMSDGEFTILDVQFAPDGSVVRFDIDFELAGDSDLIAGEFFRGSFRYVVPAPASAAVLAAAGLTACRRRRA